VLFFFVEKIFIVKRGISMKKNLLFISVVVFLIGCQTTETAKSEKSAPGLETMRKFGTELNSNQVLNMIGDSMRTLVGGGAAYSIYNAILSSPNANQVFVVSSIEYNEDGLAVKIDGKIETPATIRDYVLKGGLGSPIYEAVEPNEFGVIFGRKGNVAVRDGVIVKTNPFETAEMYDITINSATYDKIAKASLLFQAFEVARTPYLKNMLVELEGMVLNSASKDVIIQAMIEYKKNNPKATHEMVMVEVLSQQSFLDEIRKSNSAASERIRKSGELLNAIGAACALKSVEIAEHFARMALDIASLFSNPLQAPGMIANYVTKNVPQGRGMTFTDLDNIQKYGEFQMKRYQANTEKNRVLWEKAFELQTKL